jgi:conjugal transfer pilus assembly protein TraV
MNPIRLLPLTLVFVLTGCANVLNTANHAEFACPGMPDGVMCKSPLQVYRATDDATHDTTPDRDSLTAAPVKRSGAQTSQAAFDDGSGLVSRQTEKAARDKPPALPLPLHLPTHLPIAQSASPHLPLPILEPAKVMRIWIAPWEDSKKDLHWPSYLFTEIQPRKWSFGKAEFTGSRPVVPHLMVTPSAQPTLPDRSESGRVGSVQPVSSPQAVTGIPEAALPQAGDALLGGR